ncbi:MAG: S-layer homology domain-containing protein [Acidimicrobiales bacterium]
MSLSHLKCRTVIASAITLAVSFSAVVPASGAEAAPEQVLLAPFACGTEWQGTTYSGHGQGDLTLDLNRTSLVWPDPLHDLGQPILAQGDGVVVHVAQDGWNSGAGTYAEVDYGDVTAVYVHLVENSIAVEVGDVVTTGQLLGLLGNSGNIVSSTAEKLAHLHLAYWDSTGVENARAYQLSTQIPVRISGVDYVATASPRTPSAAFVSTNCEGETFTPPHPFTDVDTESFAYDDIALLYELAITQGTGTSSYSPHESVDREQMAAFLARIWRLLAPETPVPEGEYPFDDVDPDSFAYDDIHLIFELGITTGTGHATYSPDDEVSREQMAAFLNRLHELLDPPVAASPPNPDPDPFPDGPIYPFDDVAPSSFAYDDIARIHQLGITTGTSRSTYSPAEVVDREQMAAFLARVYRLLAPPVAD